MKNNKLVIVQPQLVKSKGHWYWNNSTKQGRLNKVVQDVIIKHIDQTDLKNIFQCNMNDIDVSRLPHLLVTSVNYSIMVHFLQLFFWQNCWTSGWLYNIMCDECDLKTKFSCNHSFHLDKAWQKLECSVCDFNKYYKKSLGYM